MRKIILSILLLLCLSMTGLIYADGEGNGNGTGAADDLAVCPTDMFTCPSGMLVPRIQELNCEFAPCPEYVGLEKIDESIDTGADEVDFETHASDSSTTDNSISETPTMTLAVETECQTKIQAINEQIIAKDKNYKDELKLLLPGYYAARAKYLNAVVAYKECVSRKISDKLNSVTTSASSQSGGSGMTANVVVANANANINRRLIAQNASVVPNLQTATATSAIMPVDTINVDELDLEIIELPDTNATYCKDQRAVLKTEQTELKAEILKINTLREKYKSDYTEIQTLETQKKELVKSCYPERALPGMMADCKVSKELLEKRKELEKQLMKLQNEFTSENSANKEEFIATYKQVKEEHRMISEKISSIESTCKQTARIMTQENRCQPNEGLMQEINKIKNSLSIETDPDKIYQLKTALEYALKKMNNGCGISNLGDVSTTATNAQPISEAEMLRQEIQRLKSQIQDKDKEINSLRESMRAFTGEMKVANAEQKTKLLEDNFEKVLEHTTAVITSRIAKLKEKINEIETSKTISEENKVKIISDLNDRIASLNQILDKLANAITADELKQIMADSKVIDEHAILEGRITSLNQSISKLNEILEKYYVTSDKYETYKASITELLTKVSTLTEDTTKDEFEIVVNEYKDLKRKIIDEGKNVKLKAEVNN
ncbi:MAG: hypothetical protein WCX82_04480 [archaeon]|jgi:hypothetical protein